MKRILVTLVASALFLPGAMALHGCGKATAPSHAGTWELDTQLMKDAMAAEIAAIEDPEERRAMEMGMAVMGSTMLEQLSMTLTLDPDGSASVTSATMGDSETLRGTWSAEGNLLVIVMEQDGESRPASARVDGDTLELLPPEADDMPFRMIMRKREP